MANNDTLKQARVLARRVRDVYASDPSLERNAQNDRMIVEKLKALDGASVPAHEAGSSIPPSLRALGLMSSGAGLLISIGKRVMDQDPRLLPKTYAETKPLAVGTGATIGTALGLGTLGPSLGTSALAVPPLAATGALVGGAIHDVGGRVIRAFNPDDPVEINGTIYHPKDEQDAEVLNRMAFLSDLKGTRNESMLEALLPGASREGGMAVRRGLNLALGMTDKARARAHRLARMGFDASIQDVSSLSIVRNARKAFGAFPTIAEPFRRAAADASERLLGEGGIKDRILFDVGPIATLWSGGTKIRDSGNRAYRRFRKAATARYESALDHGEQVGMQIPLSNARKANTEQAKRTFLGGPGKEVMEPTGIIDEAGQPMMQAKRKRVPLPGYSHLKAIHRRIREMNLDASPREYQALGFAINDAIGAARRGSNEERALIRIKKALEDDLMNARGPEEAIRRLNDADEFFSRGMKEVFDTPGARRIGRVEKGFGHVTTPDLTARAPDELARVMLENTSPGIVRDFRRIMFADGLRGRVAYWKAIGAHMNEKIMKHAITVPENGIEIMMPQKAIEAFGLNRPQSSAYKLTQTMLEGTPITIKDLKKFFGAVDTAFSLGVAKTAEMARRRVALGGAKALAGTFTLGVGTGAVGMGTGSVMAGAVTAATMWALTRGFAEVITRPGALRALTRAIDPAATETVKRQAMRRMAFIVPALTARGFLGQGEAARDLEDAYAKFTELPLREIPADMFNAAISAAKNATQGGTQ